MTVARQVSLALALVSIACVSERVPHAGESATTGDPDPEPNADGEPNVEPASTTADEPSGPPSSFLTEHDAGSDHECSTLRQDCPAGHKCAAWASMGGVPDATRCVPIAPTPDQPGDSCTVLGSPNSGEDSCDLGSWCMRVDPDTGLGTCFEFCSGDWSSLTCPDPDTYCAGGYRDFPVCTESCCPVEQTCPEGEGCFPVADDFTCGAPWNPGVYGDGCEFVNECERGLFCGDPQNSSDCADGAAGCCLPFCRLGSNDCLAYSFELSCEPWFEALDGSPGHASIGHCVEVVG